MRGSANSETQAGELLLDGVLVEGRIRVLSGNLGPLTLYHCTLGASAAGLGTSIDVEAAGGTGEVINNANLAICLDHCISGPVTLPDSVATLTIADSIIAEDRLAEGHGLTTTTAIEARGAELVIESVFDAWRGGIAERLRRDRQTGLAEFVRGLNTEFEDR